MEAGVWETQLIRHQVVFLARQTVRGVSALACVCVLFLPAIFNTRFVLALVNRYVLHMNVTDV